MEPEICCCDFFPGIHPRYLDCDPDYGRYTHEPWSKKEIEQQKNCSHQDTYDGVCHECGLITNTEEVLEANKRNY